MRRGQVMRIQGHECFSKPVRVAGTDWEETLFFWAPKSLQMVTAAMKLKDAYSLEGKL